MAQSAPLVLRLMASSVTAATRAGKIIRDIMSRGELGIVEKGKNDLQTEADRSAQRCIMASLSQQYPSIAIVGEEGPSNCEVPSDWVVTDCDQSILSSQCPPEYLHVTDKDVTVWVDPLDGTSEYTQIYALRRGLYSIISRLQSVLPVFRYDKDNEFNLWNLTSFINRLGLLDHVTVLVGIAIKGRAVGGVIHQPYYNYTLESGETVGRTFWGLVGLGVGGLTPQDPPPGRIIITTTRSHSDALVQMALDAFNPDEILRVGGAGHKVMLLMEGKAHAYVFASKGCKKWDTCAPEAVLTALGGKLTDIHGNSYDYHKDVEFPNKRGVLATARGISHSFFVSKIPQEVRESLA